MKEHHLDIDGHSIAAFEYNADKDSTPLVFIHGIGSIVQFWEPLQIQPVGERYHWYSISLPGHYPARFPADFRRDQLTPGMVGRILSESVQQLTGGKPVILIGYSTGGFAAYCIAHQAPELVERLIIVDGFSQGTWYGALRLPQMLARLGSVGSLLFSGFNRMGTSNFAAFRWAYVQLGSDHAAVSAYPGFDTIARDTLTMVKKHDLRSLSHYYNVMPRTDIGDWLKEIEQPVHLIHGTEDAIIKPEHAEDMHSLLPNSTLTWIEGSGHLPMLERPQEYEAALIEALAPA